MGTEKKDQQERRRENDKLEGEGIKRQGRGLPCGAAPSPWPSPIKGEGKSSVPVSCAESVVYSALGERGVERGVHRGSAVHAALTLALSQREREG